MNPLHRMSSVALAMGLTLGAGAALAQTAAPAAPPAPAWKQGMPESMATSTLAPLAGKNTTTAAADIPIDKINCRAGAPWPWVTKARFTWARVAWAACTR